MGKSISYAELDALTRDFAAWLHANGLGKGDRIALMMPNLLQYPVLPVRRLARRLRGGQLQSALHRARA